MDSCVQYIKGKFDRHQYDHELILLAFYWLDGITYRGCKNTACTDQYCIECQESNCNNQPVPLIRIRCNRCNETVDERCSDNLENIFEFLQYCPIYDVENSDVCLSVLDDDMNIVRGCKTDTEIFEICTEKEDQCRSCKTDGCNYEPKFSKPKLSCIKCTSTAFDSSCEWGFNQNKALLCQEDLALGDQEECYIQTNDSKSVSRGCLNDDKNACTNATTCKKICSTAGCNNENILKDSCIICDSKTNPLCASSRPKINPTTCTNEIQEYNKQGCVTYKDKSTKNVVRDCYSSLTEEQKDMCLFHERRICEICKGRGCNNKEPPNRGVSLNVKMPLLVFILCLIML